MFAFIHATLNLRLNPLPVIKLSYTSSNLTLIHFPEKMPLKEENEECT